LPLLVPERVGITRQLKSAFLGANALQPLQQSVRQPRWGLLCGAESPEVSKIATRLPATRVVLRR